MVKQKGLKKNALVEIQQFYSIVDSIEFLMAIPPYCGGRNNTKTKLIIKALANIYTRKLLSFEVMRDGINIHFCKEGQLLTEGVPLDYEILKQCLWSIDRTMSNRVLQYWILKFRPFMRYLDLIQCDEFLYLLTNTVAKNQLLKRLPKIKMDITLMKEGLIYDFRPYNIENKTIKRFKSPDSKIQYYFNSLYHPKKSVIISKFINTRQHSLKDKKKEKQEQQEDEEYVGLEMVLRDPQVYSELSLKLKKQKLLLNKVRHNSHNLKGDIFENMTTAHDIGLHESNNLVEDILDSDEYVNRKHKSLQNMEFEMMNGLINRNIIVAKDYYDSAALEQEIDYELNYSLYNKEDSGSISRGSLSDLLREKKSKNFRWMKKAMKEKKKTKKPSSSRLDTAIESMLDDELEKFEMSTTQASTKKR